jgi:acyl-CoA synthetase (AMP-forming)/AMP-acid ligase II
MVAEPGIHRIEVTTLGDLLDLRAAELGEHLALVFPDHQVTYAGLAERAGFFARGLLAAGLEPGQAVGILLPSTPSRPCSARPRPGCIPSPSTPVTRARNWPT